MKKTLLMNGLAIINCVISKAIHDLVWELENM